ncbi:MAG: type ISP restriction/modification enzyme [bacterium]
MKYDDIIAKYLKDLQSEYKQAKKNKQHTDELSFRPILHELFKELSKFYTPMNTHSIVLEPRNQNKVGRPDWLIQDSKSLAVYGYIEAKGIAPKAFDIENHQEQVDRYRSLGHRLVITDGLDFLFCDPDKSEPEVVSLIDKKYLESGVWWQLKFNDRFDFIMRAMFSKPRARTYDENTLVEHVAVRTKYLAEELKKYASMSEDEAVKNKAEKAAVKFIVALRDVACNNSDSRLRTPEALSAFISQIVMFTLLYAHRVTCKNEDAPITKENRIRDFVANLSGKDKNLKPFAEMMNFVATHKESDIISTWTEECISFLSFVKLSGEARKNPNYHKLFEKFLAEYNAQMRFDFGAYYTPEMLANYTVRLTEYIVKMELGADVYADQNTIIDPCCGTGSFLEEFIKNNPKGKQYTLCGFEILPAPYMLANYRIAVVEKEIGGGPRKVNIVLANTLHNCVSTGKANDSTIEGAELNRARSLSGKPLQLIIGNPPCSDTLRVDDGDEYSMINTLMEDFRPPATERRGRQNTQKQINNPFMQFMRWSCEKLLTSKTDSAIAFVVPLSFLEAESYKYARRYLSEKFSSIWAVSVDSDARTGIRSNSLFHTMQGRAVIIATRRGDANNKTTDFHYADLSRLDSAEKEAALKEPILKCVNRFSKFKLRDDLFSFVPVKPFDESFYAKFWLVSSDGNGKAVFKQHCSGVKLAPTALFTHVSKGALKRRSKDIAEKGVIGSFEWFQKQDKPPHEEKIEAFQNAFKANKYSGQIDSILEKNIRPYVFRPFVYSNVLMWRELLDEYARIGGGGTRLRPELLKTFFDGSALGFAMAHAPKDLNPTLSQFVSFCWDLPDNDMCTRGNSHIYLNKYYSKLEDKVVSNIDPDLLSSVESLLKCGEDEALKQLIYYTYAILCSQVYLDEFEGALFTTNQSDHRARIPFSSDKKLFRLMAGLGEELAKLEAPDQQAGNVLKLNYSAIAKKLPEDFKMSASASHFDEENELLYLSDGDTEIKIPCPLAIQRLNISGYAVLKAAWLKFNSYNFTHTDFGEDELRKLLDLINVLAVRQQTIAKIDVAMSKIFASGSLIEPTPPDGSPGRGNCSSRKNASGGTTGSLIQHVPAGMKFVDYLPHYTIEAACGKFGQDKAIDMDGWIKVQAGRKLNKSMFIVSACGHSMEPMIADGELCVFKKTKAVSRNGQIVLAMHDEFHDGETGGAYSIKQFMCTKGVNPDSGKVENVSIVLKPINKAYDDIELKNEGDDSMDYRIVGEHLFSIDR